MAPKLPLLPPPGSAAYEVGYAKPPTATRFKKGTSGNPKGRPKGARNKVPGAHEERLRQIIMEEAYRPLKVVDGTKQVTVPMATAVVRAISVNAAKGNTRAQKLFTEMLTTTEKANRDQHFELFEVAVKYKQDWAAAMASARSRGVPVPEPVPHPDHIKVNPYTGEVTFLGPMTEDQRDAWRECSAHYHDCISLIEYCQAKRIRARTPRRIATIDAVIARAIADRDRFKAILDQIGWGIDEAQRLK